jgi:peptidase M28-like protein
MPASALSILLLVLLAACSNRRLTRGLPLGSGSQAGSPPAASVVASDPTAQFDSRAAFDTLSRLADPSMEGRHVGTDGELKGAQYIAGLFEADGLKPGGDSGGYLQSFPMTIEEQASTPTLEISNKAGEKHALKLRDDFRPVFGGSGGAGDASGPGLFVPPDADLKTLDLKGKVLFVLNRGSLRELITRARDQGAVGVIVPTGEQPILKSEGRAPDANAIPVALVSQTGAAALLEGSGHTRDDLNEAVRNNQPLSSFPLQWTITYHVSLKSPAKIDAHNVVGVLPGRPGSKAILVGAHYEEIGPDPDGAVYPAANDNASGVAVMLELATLLHKRGIQPAQTIIFAAWSGHEEGLFGSRYYLDHPVQPIDQTILYLNIDTVGQGSGSTVDAFASNQSAKTLADTAVQAIEDSGNRANVRIIDKAGGSSDDETFTPAGVPTIALSWTGLFSGSKIHTPDDTPSAVDPAKLGITGNYAAAVLTEAAK